MTDRYIIVRRTFLFKFVGRESLQGPRPGLVLDIVVAFPEDVVHEAQDRVLYAGTRLDRLDMEDRLVLLLIKGEALHNPAHDESILVQGKLDLYRQPDFSPAADENGGAVFGNIH